MADLKELFDNAYQTFYPQSGSMGVAALLAADAVFQSPSSQGREREFWAAAVRPLVAGIDPNANVGMSGSGKARKERKKRVLSAATRERLAERGALIKQIMKEHGCALPEASKILKMKGLS
jgi:hypothetical protein